MKKNSKYKVRTLVIVFAMERFAAGEVGDFVPEKFRLNNFGWLTYYRYFGLNANLLSVLTGPLVSMKRRRLYSGLTELVVSACGHAAKSV